jgi:glyoxylase-like metal-dependent hydrolase (beta-lactamase superfamily II)
MEEILPGVFHWKAVHPNLRMEVGCHFLAGSGTAIDPLLPAEGVEWFDDRGVQRVVLSNRHHLRHAPQLAARLGCPILCHEAGLHEFEGGPQVDGFAFGDRLADDVVALEMDAICPEDTVLRIEADGGALLFADSLIHYGAVGFVPDNLIGEDPEDVKGQIRERCAALLDEDFEHLLFAHGDPLIGGGHDALRSVAEG